MRQSVDAIRAQVSRLFSEGRFREALAVCEANAAVGKRNAIFLGLHGATLGALGEVDRSVEILRKAIRLDPMEAQYHVQIAETYLTAGELDRARAALEHALAIRPGHPFATATLAHVLNLQGEPQAAYDLCIRAKERKPAVAVMLAEACERLKRFDEGVDVLQPFIDPTLPAIMRRQAWYMLGRLKEKQGEYDDAFECYTNGNALYPEPFDPDVHEARVDRLLDAWTDATIPGMPASTSDASPIFIVGMPRSGTSLVEQILDAHPDVHGCGELSDVQTFVDTLEPNAPNQTPLLTEPKRLSSAALQSFADGFMARHLVATHLTDKQPTNFLHLGVIRQAFPNARIVHCRRDPLDTCLSCYVTNLGRLPSFTNELVTLGRYHGQYLRIVEHFDALMPIVHIDYETLVDEQEQETRRLLGALDLEWDDACLRYHESKRIVVTASNDQVRQPIYRSSIGRAERFGSRLDPLREALSRRS